MIGLLEERRPDVEELCRRYGVARLSVFGSAANDRFDPDTSDLDFLVSFMALPPGRRADAYFGLLEGLEDLFGREIDLVEEEAIRNPYHDQPAADRGIVLRLTEPRGSHMSGYQ
jgi:predicted nucleotidyltransferase